MGVDFTLCETRMYSVFEGLGIVRISLIEGLGIVRNSLARGLGIVI
jgi:hypothetical protein